MKAVNIEENGLLDEVKYYNNMLYGAQYGIPIEGDYKSIWDLVKSNEEVLRGAIKSKKNKWNEDTLYGSAIAEAILIYHNEIPKDIYQELVNTIYSSRKISRTALEKPFSFMLLTLSDYDLKLTEEQKKVAVEEAMDSSITNHGYYPFDIRYRILMNPNWTIEEKADLIYDFYERDQQYDELLESWEWAIINDDRNYKDTSLSILDKVLLYEYSYYDLYMEYQNREDANYIYEEITMCKLFHQMRPQQWEITASEPKTYAKKMD